MSRSGSDSGSKSESDPDMDLDPVSESVPVRDSVMDAWRILCSSNLLSRPNYGKRNLILCI